jgi:F-type H+-transporting ATPase subunit a
VPQIHSEKTIIVAQGEPEHNTPKTEVGGSHDGDKTETVGHGESHEGGHNLLKEHEAFYYSFVGLGVATLLVVVFGLILSRNLTKRNPGKAQLLLEQAVASMRQFCVSIIGPGGEKYTAFVGTLFAYVLVCNLCGVLPLYWQPVGATKEIPNGSMAGSFTPAPSANLSMTLALGIIVFVYFNYVGIKANGVKNYFGHLFAPIPGLPFGLGYLMGGFIGIIETFSLCVRPFSLGLRLFGNVFGEETVIAVLIAMGAGMYLIPVQFPMLAFGVFGGLVQAGVFAILTSSYIGLAIGDHAHDEHHGHDEGHANNAHHSEESHAGVPHAAEAAAH